MLYATTESGYQFSGHICESALRTNLIPRYADITEIQADGAELALCCAILGRKLPSMRVYTFLGNNAKEIAVNWTH